MRWQGTGLGLSLACDIETKGHHGEIKVNTREEDGTEFYCYSAGLNKETLLAQ